MELLEHMNAGTAWEQDGYGDVIAARRQDELLEVSFANGDVVALEPAPLGLAWEFEAQPAEGGAAVLIRTPEGEREVDWLVIRSASDPEFARELRDRDAEEARRVGRRLRVLRENRGITQKAAAAMVGMSSPQLAKLERGDTDMRISTLRSILRALSADFADISRPDAPEVSVKELAKRAALVGVPADLVKRLGAALEPSQLSGVLARGFGWKLEDLASGALSPPIPAAAVVLKQRGDAGEKGQALLALAESLARRSALAYEGRAGTVPSDPSELRAALLAEGGQITLASLLRWCWANGVVVVPMDAKAGFSAGVWRLGPQPVVVIKEAPSYQAHWLFALAHELGHIARGHVADAGVVDVDRGISQSDDEQEREANAYALDLLVPDHTAMLAEVRRRAEGPEAPKRFKWKAKAVAEEHGYNVPLVLLIAAYGLPDVARVGDRWGSAIEEAKLESPARPLVAAEFARHVDLARLDRLDSLLVSALALGASED